MMHVLFRENVLCQPRNGDESVEAYVSDVPCPFAVFVDIFTLSTRYPVDTDNFMWSMLSVPWDSIAQVLGRASTGLSP